MANPGPATSVSNNPQNLSSNQALRLLASYQGVNVNAAGDTILPILDTSRYSVSNVIFTNASVSLSSAAAGLFTAPGASGAIVSNAALSALTSASVVSQRTVASTAAQSGQNLYLNVGTPQGAAATMDVFVYGYDLTFLP